MKKIQPKLALSKIPDQELDNYTQDKINKIEGNANFPSAQGMISSLKTVLAEYITALDNMGAGKSETARKNQLREELEALITRVATFCVLDANENLSAFLESGFDIRSQGSPVGQFAKPTSFKFILGENSGEAFASMEAFPKAKAFSFAWTTDPLTNNSIWTVIPSTRREYAFTDLASGVKIWAKGAAVSPDGTINYSDPVSRIIQ